MHLKAVRHAQRDRARVDPRWWPPEAVAVSDSVGNPRSPSAAIAAWPPWSVTSIKMPPA
jgi:hypothetical protein